MSAAIQIPGATAPRLGTAFRAEYRLILRSIATVGRLVAIGALALLSLGTAIVVHLSHPYDPLGAGTGYVNANVATLIPVAVLVFGAASLGDLMDDGSLVYLWLRPVPGWIHVAAAWAATVTVILPIVLAPVVLAAAIIDPSSALIGSTVLAGTTASVAYAAIFVTAGVRFRRALPWGLVYILIWEGFIASAGKTATKLAIRSYVRSILSNGTGVPIKLAVFSTPASIAVPLAVAVLSLAYATRRLARSDIA